MPPPRATYRLQLGPDLGFAEAAQLVPYLAELGVSHLYTSPLMEAEQGSTHGYDVVDPHAVRQELGGPEGLRSLWEVLAQHGLGQVLDIVPNHLSIASERNAWWWDVLRNGPTSDYADHFDIEWEPPDPDSRGRVVLPFLDRDPGSAIADGSLTIELDERLGQVVRHHEHRWPLRPDGPSDGPVAELLAAQHYRLVCWRDRERLLNYRRFFEIDTLAAVRADVPNVFQSVHAGVAALLDDELGGRVIDGIRVDHIDGLGDPEGYLGMLRDLVGGRWVVVEKILGADEDLPATWPVAGTTGYDTGATLTQLLTDATGGPDAIALARYLDASQTSWAECVLEAKREHLAGPLRPELERAVRAHGGPPENAARQVISDALALPVYREYGPPDDRFARRFAQLTVALTAKSVEDTAMYRWLPLLALDEVGADPGTFGQPPASALADLRELGIRWPATMASISTHDSKRSADVRARLVCLSEDVSWWSDTVRTWMAAHAGHRRNGWPDDAVQYLLYQTLVGAWPLTTERLTSYALKAAREAKRHTSWMEPDPTYESALETFVGNLLDDPVFVASLEEVVARIAGPGRVTALSQVALLLTAVGIPDLYQGDELWNLNLVDPDNRRPVDFGLRRSLLRDVTAIEPAELWGEDEAWGGDEAGLTKLALIHHLLRLRADRPESFSTAGELRPLPVSGPDREHVVSFTRGDHVAVVVPRLVLSLDGRLPQASVSLPTGEWRDVLSDQRVAGGECAASGLFARFPLAVLVS